MVEVRGATELALSEARARSGGGRVVPYGGCHRLAEVGAESFLSHGRENKNESVLPLFLHTCARRLRMGYSVVALPRGGYSLFSVNDEVLQPASSSRGHSGLA